MHITAQGCRLRNDLYTVSCGTLNSTIPYHTNIAGDGLYVTQWWMQAVSK